MHRTRVKLCGLTLPEEVNAAAKAGADAVGFVFYPDSARYISPEAAADLIAAAPPFVTTTGLFVNASLEQIKVAVKQSAIGLLQFHGDETPEYCFAAAQAVNRPFIRALRVSPALSKEALLTYEQDYLKGGRFFAGLLLDAFGKNYGGSGELFDWSIIPKALASRIILSGGLCVDNVADAIRQVEPYAVDVSSGIEVTKGVKDIQKMYDFIAAVRATENF